MQIIQQVTTQISENHHSGSSIVLANALASACNSSYGVSLLAASVRLDSENKQLFNRLADISREPDYSNAAQDSALKWLRQNKYIK